MRRLSSNVLCTLNELFVSLARHFARIPRVKHVCIFTRRHKYPKYCLSSAMHKREGLKDWQNRPLYLWAISFQELLLCVFAAEERGHFRARCTEWKAIGKGSDERPFVAFIHWRDVAYFLNPTTCDIGFVICRLSPCHGFHRTWQV